MQLAERGERSADRRAKAVALFASKGFSQVGMRELAAFLDIAPGSLYHHYPSKQHLLLDICEEFYDELLAALARVKKQGRSRVRSIIRAHLNLHQELPRHFSIVLRDINCLTATQQQKIEKIRTQYEIELLNLLGCGAVKKSIDLEAGHIIASLLNTAPSWFLEQSLEPEARALLIEQVLAGAIDGLIRTPG